MARRKIPAEKKPTGVATKAASPEMTTTIGAAPAPAAQETLGVATLVFEVAGQRFGLPVEHVVQIVEMVAITPLPKAPEIVAGVISFHGHVIPVVDVRRRLNLAPQPYTLRTPIIISRIGEHITGLVVDGVSGVVEVPQLQIEGPTQIFSRETLPSLPLLSGVARLDDGLLLILDLGIFLSREEEKTLNRALARQQGPSA